MNRILKCFFASLGGLAMLACQVQAGLVEVRMDAVGAGAFVNNPAFEVQRGITFGSGTGFGFVNSNSWFLIGDINADVHYSVSGTGGGFGDFFDAGKGGAAPYITTNPNSSANFDGFRLVVLSTGPSSMGSVTVTNTSDNTTVVRNFNGLGVHTLDFRNFAGSNPNHVVFSFSQLSDGATSLVSVSAIPEPTALLLVGTTLGLGFVRRRRI